jgi:hypothetical protein
VLQVVGATIGVHLESDEVRAQLSLHIRPSQLGLARLVPTRVHRAQATDQGEASVKPPLMLLLELGKTRAVTTFCRRKKQFALKL